jgi:hypothetical protein
MFDPIIAKNIIRLSQDIKWLEGKTPDHYREMSIFNQQPNLDEDPGIDDKEYHHAPPHPAQADDSVVGTTVRTPPLWTIP